MARVFAGGIDDAEYQQWRETEAPYLEEKNRVLAASNGGSHSRVWETSSDDSPVDATQDSPRSIQSDKDSKWVSVHVQKQQSSADGARHAARRKRGHLRSDDSNAVDLSEVYTVSDSTKKERPMGFERVRPPALSRKSAAEKLQAATGENISEGPEHHHDATLKWADIFARAHPGEGCHYGRRVCACFRLERFNRTCDCA
jgi:hypothetical protein